MHAFNSLYKIKMIKNQNFTIYYDEAWRWPLAGPLFIWLICPLQKLSKKELIQFCDSKEITELKREELFENVEKLQLEWKILSTSARMTAAEIDKYWMTNTLHLTILRWMIQISNQLFPEIKINYISPNPLSTKFKANLKYNDVLNYFSKLNSLWIHIKLIMDWNRDFWLKKAFPFRNIETIISWDSKIKEIWMASIIAKVSRDRIMESLPKKYVKYNFDKHKWYGTKEHKELLEKYGPSNIHRKLFIKWIFPNHKFSKKLPEKF